MLPGFDIRKNMKKLLIISNNFKRASFRQRISIYLDKLKEAGIACDIFELTSNESSRIKLFKKAADYDAVFLQKKCLNIFDSLMLRHYSRKIIYDFDDAIMYSASEPQYRSFSHFMPFKHTAKIADCILAGNVYLAEHAGRFNKNVYILPTALNTKEYNLEKTITDGKVRLVWIGSKTTLKYLAELKEVFERIGKRYKNAVLRIIGDDFFELENMEVEKCPWSLETQGLDLINSDIGIAPLVDNRFTRGKCGFKILQYQAASLPVIASPVGVNQDFVTNFVTGFCPKNHDQWFDNISRLIDDSALRKKMGLAGKQFAKDYDIEIIGHRLCSLVCRQLGIKVTPPVEEEQVKVSICIPTYNRKEYLKETLDSIAKQSFKNYEIVIVDDGSTDGTKEMVDSLNMPINYYWQENAGDAAARNKLIDLAKGQYLAFIDSDDLFLPDSIENLVNVIEANDADVIAYGSYYRIDAESNVYGKNKKILRSGFITRYLFETIMVHSCGVMIPRKLLLNKKFNTSMRVCSDYDRWLDLSTKYPFVATNKPTFKRRRHSLNLSILTYAHSLTQYQVLRKFYYEKNGREFVPDKVARKVLSRELRRLGRMAILENRPKHGCKLLKKSFYIYGNPKSLFYWMIACLASPLGLAQICFKKHHYFGHNYFQ